MKTLVALLGIMLIGTVYGATYVPNSFVHQVKAQKPVVANMQSMIEGQIVYEVPLGTYVKKGQLVEEVDPTAFHAQVEADQANVDYCKRIYNDAQKMYETKSIATETYYSDKNDLIAAMEKYRIDKSKEDHCKIFAPFNGTVTKITTYPGSGIGDGSLIMQIIKTV